MACKGKSSNLDDLVSLGCLFSKSVSDSCTSKTKILDDADNTPNLDAFNIDLQFLAVHDVREQSERFFELYDIYNPAFEPLFSDKSKYVGSEFLDSAREKYIALNYSGCVSDLNKFCKLNQDSIVAKTLPFGKSCLTSADKNFLKGNVLEAVREWAKIYSEDLVLGNNSLKSLVTFLGGILQDNSLLREKIFEAWGSNYYGDGLSNVFVNVLALEYGLGNSLADVLQFISQHNVYEIQSETDKFHFITKFSKKGGKSRVDSEKSNLERLSSEISEIEVLGCRFHLPSKIKSYSEFSDFSVLVESFISGAVTFEDYFSSGAVPESERLAHMERLIAYTAILQETASTLVDGSIVTSEDYLSSFDSKLSKLGCTRDNCVALDNFISDVYKIYAKFDSKFYTNASLNNFMFNPISTEYHKIDFESDEFRSSIIDPITLISDPTAGLEKYAKHFMMVYSLFANEEHRLVLEGDQILSDYFYEDATDMNSFAQRYEELVGLDYTSKLVEAYSLGTMYRDITIILDKQNENLRLENSIDTGLTGDSLSQAQYNLAKNNEQIDYRKNRLNTTLQTEGYLLVRSDLRSLGIL